MADKSVVEGGESVKVPISPSIPSGNDNVWVDVSFLLRLACDDLRNDEFICGGNFDLFAAMSALEIMDPKMDSGIVSTYYSVDEAIDNGAAPVPLSFDRTTDIQRVIDIMDHLLACEATWHKGGSLAQTVFSCIYLVKPDRMSTHALLHSFCRVVRMTCNALLSAVSDARANEEEDLFIMAYGLPLKVDGDEKCLSILHAVEETVSRQLKACKAPLSRKRVVEEIKKDSADVKYLKLVEYVIWSRGCSFMSFIQLIKLMNEQPLLHINVEPLQTNFELEEGFCKAVLCRLRFRKHFYHVLTCMRRPQGKGLELAKKHIQSCVAELDSMLESEGFLRHACASGALEGGIEDNTTASGCQPIGFDSTLNSRSATPTPPRAINLLSWKKAVNYFQKLLHDLEIVCSYSFDPVLEDALRLVVDFQKFQPDLVSRAYIQLLLVQDGKLYGREAMFAVVCKAALLPEGAKSHDVQNNETIAQLGQLLISLLRLLCSNTSWQRRKLGKILQDWRIIYVQLELAFRKDFGDITSTSVDQNACLKISKHILIWVEEQTYWIALRFLILGFELELYSTSEYCMVYWYIYVILIKLAEKTHHKMVLSNDSGRRKSKKKRDFVKDVGKDYQVPSAVLLLQCYIYVAEGLMMMLASLRNENRILCLGPFNSEQERFMQHFELLQKACLPDHASYFTFRETISNARFSTLSMYNCFKDAQKIAKELRGNFANDPDRLAELRRIEQVTEHNSVAVNLICQLGTLEPSLKISFEFIHHPHFAVAAVKRS